LSVALLWRIIRQIPLTGVQPTRSDHPSLLPRRSRWGLLFLLFTALGLLSFGYVYLDDLARGRVGTFSLRLVEEATGAYSVLALLPFIIRFGRAVQFKGKSWIRIALANLVAALIFSAAHTTLIALGRTLLFPLLGLGPYNYGSMRYRYPMEFSKDLIVFAVIIGFIYFFESLRIAQDQQLAAAELQTRLLEAQFENLRLQLHPHFLFNTLNTISSMMYEDIRAADAMLDQLSDLLRLTLHAPHSHEISLCEELHITRLYLDLMQKRFENKLQITYSIDPALNDSLVPQLILQPLVENSLRHGMKPGNACLDLSIAVQRDDCKLVILVSDTGSGLGAVIPSHIFNRGVGLSNIRGRLAQLYGDDHEFAIANRPAGGTEVTLRVPYHTAARALQVSG
jgi:two-component system, LytTR family, sensor kinase